MPKLLLSSSFSLPSDFAALTSAILGIRGSGKTSTAVVCVEELLQVGHQVVVIDPTDVWWGLKSSSDGKQPGFPVVVLGGEHGDLPIDAASGAPIADFLVEQRASAILSLRHLRKGDQRRFVTDCAERLYHRKGEGAHRTPALLVIDECDAFIPQRVGGAEARMVGAIEDLVRRGRAAGIGVCLISQRAASINKDVLTQIELLVAHRHTSPQDRKALEAWIEAHDTAGRQREFMGSLASLAVGTAWFWSPGWLDVFESVKVRQRSTCGSSSTPKSVKQASAPKAIAEIDLDKLRESLKATVEQAAANDPKELRRKIAELERDLREATKADPYGPEFKIKARVFYAISELQHADSALDSARKILAQRIENLQDILGPSGDTQTETAAPPKAVPQIRPTAVKAYSQTQSSSEPAGGGIRRILIALAQRPQGLSAKQLGVRAGLSSSSGTFGTYLAKCRSAGWIDGSRDRLVITEAGRAYLGSFDPLPTGQELLAYWLGKLGSGCSRMLQALADAYPQSLTKHQVGEAAGISATSGTFGTYLSQLRTLELVSGRGELRASEELFD